MKRSARLAASAAAFLVSVQPCLAADDLRDYGNPERRTGTFAGASVRLSLGARAQAKPSARLQLGMRHVYRESRAEAPATAHHAGLEFGASRAGKPALFIGGQQLSTARQRLGLDGAAAPFIVGGVVLVAVAAIALVAAAEDFEDDCFLCTD